MKSAFYIIIFIFGIWVVWGQLPTGIASIAIGIIGFVKHLDDVNEPAQCDDPACEECGVQRGGHIR